MNERVAAQRARWPGDRMPLYKYIQSEFVEHFLDGFVRFQPLTYYQRWEADRSIGDPHEAMLLFRPKAGLSIYNLTTDQRFTLPATFVSSIVANDVFVFCVSQRLDQQLARDFRAEACVEILDTRKFVLDLQRAVKGQVEAGVLINGPVAYYESEDPAGVNWALPDTIVRSKRSGYAGQSEYRFAFANRRVLKIGNTIQRLQFGEVGPIQPPMLAEPRVLDIGSIRNITAVHSWPVAYHRLAADGGQCHAEPPRLEPRVRQVNSHAHRKLEFESSRSSTGNSGLDRSRSSRR